MSGTTVLVAWVLVYLVIYFASETAQRFLYDTLTDGLWWRAMVAALPLALLLVLLPCRLDDMFSTRLLFTILHAVAWFLLFWLLCGYTVAHGAFVGIASFFLFSWMVTMAVDSLVVWLGTTGTA